MICFIEDLTIGHRFWIEDERLSINDRIIYLLVGVETDCPSTGVSDPLAVDVC